MTQREEDEEKIFGCIPYNVYRWSVCFTVMLVLIPMAGTMTSFGAIKQAVTTTQECIPTNITGRMMEAKVDDLKNCTIGIQDITEWSRIGYADVDKTVLSLVGSLVFGFTVGASFITSPLIARFGYRKMGLIGVTTGIIALLLTMWVNNFYWWFITYSVSFGISNNLLYNTGMQMCNAFFPTDYNTAATVIASFGISLGTMVMNPLSVYLTDTFGWRYRFAACAAILAMFGYPCCFYWTQPHPVQEQDRKIFKNSEEKEDLVDSKTDEVEMVNPADTMNLFSSVVFWAWCFGTTFWSLDFVIPLDFAIGFMADNGIDRQDAGFVMTALGIAELVSRTLCAVTGEQRQVDKPTIYIVCSIIGAAACCLPIYAYKTQGEKLDITIMYIYGIIVGFCAGVLNCLIMACTVDIFGQKRTVEVWNYVNLMLGIGFVGGPFVGAWFTSSIVSDLVYVFYLAIGFFLMCAIVMAPIPRGMKALQPRPAEKYELNNNNNNNREDTAMMSK